MKHTSQICQHRTHSKYDQSKFKIPQAFNSLVSQGSWRSGENSTKIFGQNHISLSCVHQPVLNPRKPEAHWPPTAWPAKEITLWLLYSHSSFHKDDVQRVRTSWARGVSGGPPGSTEGPIKRRVEVMFRTASERSENVEQINQNPDSAIASAISEVQPDLRSMWYFSLLAKLIVYWQILSTGSKTN